MKRPKQVAPLKRPHFIQPYTAVDVVNGNPEDLFSIRMDLLHGANYNDPAPFNYYWVKQQSFMCCTNCSLEATRIF